MTAEFVSYLVESPHFLLARLAQIAQEICEISGEIAMIEAQAIRSRATVLSQFAADASSAARRDRVNMTPEVIEPTATAIELKGALAALVEEKWLIVRILDTEITETNGDDTVGMPNRRTSTPRRSDGTVLDEHPTQYLD